MPAARPHITDPPPAKELIALVRALAKRHAREDHARLAAQNQESIAAAE